MLPPELVPVELPELLLPVPVPVDTPLPEPVEELTAARAVVEPPKPPVEEPAEVFPCAPVDEPTWPS